MFGAGLRGSALLTSRPANPVRDRLPSKSFDLPNEFPMHNAHKSNFIRPSFASKFPLVPLALALSLASAAALSQTAPAIPGAGQLLRQAEPSTAVTPALSAPALKIAPPAATNKTAPTDITRVTLTSIKLTGNTVFDSPTLMTLVVEAVGKPNTFAQIDALAQRITDYYQTHGQPLARAYLPEQVMTDGALQIAVIEAVYGKVSVVNKSAFDTARLEAFAVALKPGQLVDQAPLDRTLLLLRELGGIDVTANARAGAVLGSTDLTITAVEAPRTSGTYSMDNYGSHATGRGRVMGTVQTSNQLGYGEAFSATGLTSGTGMFYERLAAEAPINGFGTRAGIGRAHLHYSLGSEFSSLRAHGSADVADAFVRQALVRSPGATVNAEIRLEHKSLKDRVDSTGAHTDRTVNIASASLSGALHDSFSGGGDTNFSLEFTGGHSAFSDAAALALDQSKTGAHTQGRYGRVNVSLSRLQSLGTDPLLSGTTVFASVKAQSASKNLDISEQMSIGGPQSVRGYDTNAISGAQGYVATFEVRQMLPAAPSGTWQAKLFVDAGRAQVYKNAFTAANAAALRNIGLGLNWANPNGWNGQLVIAQPVSSASAIPATQGMRAWLMVGNKF